VDRKWWRKDNGSADGSDTRRVELVSEGERAGEIPSISMQIIAHEPLLAAALCAKLRPTEGGLRVGGGEEGREGEFKKVKVKVKGQRVRL